MKNKIRKHHKNLAALVIIVALSGVIIASHLTGILDYVEFKLYDLRINLLAGSSRRSDDIVVVLLEQDCLEWAQKEKGWGWPWPRKAYADFIDYMNLGGAKSVAFDVIFSEPSLYRSARQDQIIEDAVKNLESAQAAVSQGNPKAAGPLFRNMVNNLKDLSAREDDASFAEAERKFGKTVQVVFFSSQSGSVNTWPGDLNKPLFKPENFGSDIARFELPGDERLTGAQFPVKEIRDAAAVIGNVTGKPDKDEVIRRNRLFTVFDGKAVPGLSAACLLAAGNDGTISFDSAKNLITWGDRKIPVDKDGKTLLRFRGPLTLYAHYKMSDVLKSAEDYAAGKEPLLPPDIFKDSYVFFGFYAPGLFDIFNTPISSVYPGMGVHVTLLDNMLMGDFIQKVSDWIAVLMIAVSIILVVILVLYIHRVAVTVEGIIALLAAQIIAGFWAFHTGYWIPMAAPIIGGLLAYLTSTLYSYATEGKDKRFLKQAFSQVVSPKLVDQLIVDPSQLKLGGEKRKMTAIFTDIQRFSSISSELQEQYGEDGPKVLVNLLNLYLTKMSNVVIDNGGTIDKYEGDAIIAFFGAPVWMEDHASRACRSAILMKKQERELVETVMDPEGEFHIPLNKLIENKVIRKERPLYTRLGINTGDMVVGFMGTTGKKDYTIMGNAVNLAARLEGVNKQYDTHGILISEYTRNQIGDEFIIRPLSRVTVVGIPVPLRLYELLDLTDDASPELLEMLAVWEKAFKVYESKDFGAAKKMFAGIFQNDPEDSVARLYMQRCEKYILSPPPANWDGVDNLTEK
ncbi:MAG: adenylate/guanylate cyclase domain-containing protein [Treponema sp.]|nr:adenylate/guanylate cyclase domain-containing protein [Treponema sp.]